MQTKVVMPPWSDPEDDIIREEWAKGRSGAAARSHARLPSRTQCAIQQHASFIFRRDGDPSPRKPPTKTAETRAVTHRFPVRPEPVVPRPVRQTGACDPGDVEYIRKRLHNIALALANELARTPDAIFQAIAQVAAGGFKQLAPSRIMTTEQVTENLSSAIVR